MKLKNWASKTLVAIMGAMIILAHTDNTIVQIAAVVIAAASAYIYAKYSKYVDWR